MNETIADLGEFALIDRMTKDVLRGPQVGLGPGDDAAVMSVDGSLVVSTDVFIQHVHFRTDWSGPADIGHRCVGGAVADIEAMGAVPTAIVVAASLPKTTEVAWVDRWMSGVLAECESAQVSLVGGDLSAAEQMSFTVTALGQTCGRQPILRSGAQVGDAVAYKGRVGWAGAGLAVLTRGFRSPRIVVQAYQRPQIPYGAGVEAAKARATSLIDVSDGMIQDLAHIATQSGVVIDIDSARLDIEDILKTVASATGREVMDLVLTGGEDHAIVGTFPWGEVPTTWTVIGRVIEAGLQDPGVLVDGQQWLGEQGWTHF